MKVEAIVLFGFIVAIHADSGWFGNEQLAENRSFAKGPVH